MRYSARISSFLLLRALELPRPLQNIYSFFFQRLAGSRVIDYCGGNRLQIRPGITSGLRVVFFGKNNTILLHQGAKLKNVEVNIVASGVLLEIHPNTSLDNVYFWIGGDFSVVTVGSGSYLLDNRIVSTDNHSTIEIGQGCMMGTGSQIRLGDGHTVYDVSDGAIFNRGEYVKLANRVWLAQDALVLKNVTIGMDSVIGARSVVTRDVPPNCVAAGIPAKVIRRGIAWRIEKIDQLPPQWFHRPPQHNHIGS